jgi:hypothetical protein
MKQVMRLLLGKSELIRNKGRVKEMHRAKVTNALKKERGHLSILFFISKY